VILEQISVPLQAQREAFAGFSNDENTERSFNLNTIMEEIEFYIVELSRITVYNRFNTLILSGWATSCEFANGTLLTPLRLQQYTQPSECHTSESSNNTVSTAVRFRLVLVLAPYEIVRRRLSIQGNVP
jgi:hypothetical protein